ncbi:MAG TPA: SdrD B-like domain-containing protein, partial [Thermoanaerobaculia bacterium]|nr:SdrD B-like domain-containing protein [Thermoanaerobaculia bacterium]
VTDPDGTVYRNDNPSGSQEWEQFRIATPLAPDASDSDHVAATDTLPGGVWRVRSIGLDMSNLNFWFVNACATRTVSGRIEPACPPAGTYLVGDTVWFDTNGNGVQDVDEAGIPGVTVELLDETGTFVYQTAVTGDSSNPNWAACLLNNTGVGTQGLYCFGVDEPVDYVVRVAASNFAPGGALAGLGSTTGGETQTDTVVDDNVLIYDFGYRGTASLGDRVWMDTDADGFQDAGEAGINDVTVQLLDGGGNVVATTTTSGNGDYGFANLVAGTYTVRVVSSTLPANLVQTYDLDGTATPHRATVQLAAGTSNNEVDFGYRTPPTYSIGDRVWKDIDNDGDQEPGEPGLNSVTVQLLNGSGTVIATTVTAGDGNYTFTNLPPATYTVRVVSSTLPTGYTPTYDPDGTATAHTAIVNLTASRVDIDFGYRSVPPQQPGTGTLGYWKTHPEAWPVQQITVGDVTYTKAQAIYLMGLPGRGDKTYDLFKQLVAAKLNVIIGNNSSCIQLTIQQADLWLTTYGLGTNVRSSSAAWTTGGGGQLHQTLDDYNNGLLCAPHRD